MKFTKIIGWIFIPFIMIFTQWKQSKTLIKVAEIPWGILVLLVWIGGITSIVDPNSNPSAAPTSKEVAAKITTTPTSKPTISQIPTYKVEIPLDMSYAGVKRLQLKVIVDSRNLNSSQIMNIAKKVVASETSGQKINALSLQFYTKDDDTSSEPTIASIMYAPNGKWDNADQAKRNYSNFKFGNFQIVELPKTNTPSEKDFKIYGTVSIYLDSHPNQDAAAYKLASKKYSVTPEQAKQIFANIIMIINTVKQIPIS